MLLLGLLPFFVSVFGFDFYFAVFIVCGLLSRCL